jgi:hypothetical protein
VERALHCARLHWVLVTAHRGNPGVENGKDTFIGGGRAISHAPLDPCGTQRIRPSESLLVRDGLS